MKLFTLAVAVCVALLAGPASADWEWFGPLRIWWIGGDESYSPKIGDLMPPPSANESDLDESSTDPTASDVVDGSEATTVGESSEASPIMTIMDSDTEAYDQGSSTTEEESVIV